jgi:hypothetical protein
LILAVVVTDAGTDDRVGWVELLSAYFADGTVGIVGTRND